MRMPNTDPRLPRYYLGQPATRGSGHGYFKPFDLNPTPSTTVRGLPPLLDNRFDTRPLTRDRMAKRGDRMNGLGDATSMPEGTDTTMPAVQNFFTSLVTAWNTEKLTQLNITRAAQGLPPITAASVSPGVNVGIDPATMTTLLTAGAIGIGVYALSRRRRK